MEVITTFLQQQALGFLPETASTIILFIIGLVLIIKGGDWFVDAAAWVAKVTGIPQFLVGATIVSLATTLPELLTSVFATMQGSTEIAIGNAVGSVTANVGLIMAISIAVLPMVMKDSSIIFKGFIMIGATLLLGLLCIGGYLSWWMALALLAVLAYFTYLNIRDARTELADTSDVVPMKSRKEIPVNIFKFLIGIIAIVIGAQLLVDTGTELATLMGVSEKLIAITLVAIGTSLPELITTITSLVKKQPGMSIGNIIGANIIDMTLILPICAFVSGGKLDVPMGTSAMTLGSVTLPSLVWLDIPVTALLMALAIVPTIKHKKFHRWQGICMMVVYVAYVVFVSSL
ncbi:MAG: calcium/sodium antiporter [Clostridia bacterium]|nr:calcium/sodium antiporter [Clostridia bacterium]